jgi:hypothetical protein
VTRLHELENSAQPLASERFPPKTEDVGPRAFARSENRNAITVPEGGGIDVATVSDDEDVSSQAHVAKEALREQQFDPGGAPGLEEFGRLPAAMQDRIAEFAAEPRDALWAASAEAQLIGALPQSNVALVDWHVECRTSVCLVKYGHPVGIDPEMLRRDDQRLFLVLTYASNLIGGRMFMSAAENGALVGVMDLHRRCGSDWTCPHAPRVSE